MPRAKRQDPHQLKRSRGCRPSETHPADRTSTQEEAAAEQTVKDHIEKALGKRLKSFTVYLDGPCIVAEIVSVTGQSLTFVFSQEKNGEFTMRLLP